MMVTLITVASTAPAAMPTFNHEGTTRDQYGQLDILCGKEISGKTHFGNIRFRAIVALHGTAYRRAGRRTLKTSLVKSILNEIRSTPGIRFLRKGRDQHWIEITDERKIRDKIGHGLRELKNHDDPLLDAKNCLTLLSNSIFVGDGFAGLQQHRACGSTEPRPLISSPGKIITKTQCSQSTSIVVSERRSTQSATRQHLKRTTNKTIMCSRKTSSFRDDTFVTVTTDKSPIPSKIHSTPSQVCISTVNSSPTIISKVVCCSKNPIVKNAASLSPAFTKNSDPAEHHMKSTTFMLQRSLGSVLDNCGEAMTCMASAGCYFRVGVPLGDFEIEAGLDLHRHQQEQATILETDLVHMNDFRSAIKYVPPNLDSDRGDDAVILMSEDILKQLDQVANFEMI